ncbi:MAG: hypothetical protein E6767_12075 [Dysgonomonas sp.]|nr:hypothetical protein [Dysgonomonas sp.]
MEKQHICKFRVIIFVFLFCTINTTLNSTEWYGWHYKFPYFEYRADQLMGSMSRSPEMFSTSVRLNHYVKQKVENGSLKDKPVIYDINGFQYERQRYLLEVFETNGAYRISINYPHFFMMYFSYKDLVKIIDYFAHPDFEPFYCDTTINKINLTRDIFFNKINPLVSHKQVEDTGDNYRFDVYQTDEMNIYFQAGEYKVLYNDNNLDIKLNPPFCKPIRFKDRYIIMDNIFFYVFEAGRMIKQAKASYLLESDIQTESNVPHIQIYSEWMNIGLNYNDEPQYSYSYRKNRLYEVDN